ncbi:hypothetical protein [uncultured Mucilaginibacter sp.]|uniref:hypothetical protein n=1 Tax=uncultured Mucilaginibacter sp. TaxID=797541 RepID=UPI0025E9C5C8|nr:hypothetical protein [uncultured Mucilaginibacter sp.]
MNKQDLIQKLKQLDGLTADERAALINLVNTKKKYGLVWEDKPEDVEEQLREKLPILKDIELGRSLNFKTILTQFYTSSEVDYEFEKVKINHLTYYSISMLI